MLNINIFSRVQKRHKLKKKYNFKRENEIHFKKEDSCCCITI